MIAIVEEEQRKREAAEYERKWAQRSGQLYNLYSEFLKKVPDGDPRMRTLPTFPDALNELPCMTTLLESDDPSRPVTEEQFSAIEPTILSESEKYRTKVIAKLVRIWQAHEAESAGSSACVAAINRSELASQSSTQGTKNRSKTKAHGDQSAAPDMTVDAHIALLELQTTVFRCTKSYWESSCNTLMSYVALLEHWQTVHCRVSCANAVSVRNTDLMKNMPALCKALRVPSTIPHSVLNSLLRSGRPTCSCGKLGQPQNQKQPWYMNLELLVRTKSSLVCLAWFTQGWLQLDHMEYEGKYSRSTRR